MKPSVDANQNKEETKKKLNVYFINHNDDSDNTIKLLTELVNKFKVSCYVGYGDD